MNRVFAFGGLFVALALLIGPTFFLSSSPSDDAAESEQVLAIRLGGIGLGQRLPDLAQSHPRMQVSVSPSAPGVDPRFTGFMMREARRPDDQRSYWARDYMLSFTGPASGAQVYSIISHEAKVPERRVAEVLRMARQAFGRTGANQTFSDERSFMTRHVRIYRWGNQRRYYMLTVERVRPTGGELEIHLQHILHDLAIEGEEPADSEPASGVEQSNDAQ